jgi:hypothetical protein
MELNYLQLRRLSPAELLAHVIDATIHRARVELTPCAPLPERIICRNTLTATDQEPF